MPNGYDSIPSVLRQMPYFVTVSTSSNSSSPSAPCDDEDVCGDDGSAEGSGSTIKSHLDVTEDTEGIVRDDVNRMHRY